MLYGTPCWFCGEDGSDMSSECLNSDYHEDCVVTNAWNDRWNDYSSDDPLLHRLVRGIDACIVLREYAKQREEVSEMIRRLREYRQDVSKYYVVRNGVVCASGDVLDDATMLAMLTSGAEVFFL